MLNTLQQLDTELFLAINNGWHNSVLDVICPWLREAKHWIPFYILLLYLVWKHYGTQVLWIAIGAGLLVFITDQFSANLIKNTFERLRPCNDPDLKLKVRLLVNCGQGYSFMSAHATNHFAIAVYFTVFLKEWIPKFGVFAFVWALSISVSQVYVGVHYPFDIIAGGLCGSLFGYLLAKIVLRKTEKFK
jgi:membrane-associated phospholipid phosphatase